MSGITGFFKRAASGPIPAPKEKLINYVGSGDFFAVGNEFLGHFTNLADLRPHEAVLDVGCGCGRMAVPLTGYFDANGRYAGFDIDKASIKWCRREITRRFPRFEFGIADIYNEAYNSKGRCKARDFRFPYDDGTFDFVFLTSVFTHLLRADVEHYLDEIVRVTKDGGRCLMTMFLLDDESEALIEAGKSTQTFAEVVEGTRVREKRKPEIAVAFPVEEVRVELASRGLKLREPMHFGNWCGREKFLSYQDILVVEKPATEAG